jgi:uncharacterized protein YdhG (YjbR/CyaY superfamily)
MVDRRRALALDPPDRVPARTDVSDPRHDPYRSRETLGVATTTPSDSNGSATSPVTVDDYIAALDGDARRIASEFREAIRRAVPGVTETVRYKMPCFLLDGRYLVHIGAWKSHIGLYPVPSFDGELEAEVAHYRAAKDTVRFRYKDPVPWDLVERILTALVDRLTNAAAAPG